MMLWKLCVSDYSVYVRRLPTAVGLVLPSAGIGRGVLIWFSGCSLPALLS